MSSRPAPRPYFLLSIHHLTFSIAFYRILSKAYSASEPTKTPNFTFYICAASLTLRSQRSPKPLVNTLRSANELFKTSIYLKPQTHFAERDLRSLESFSRICAQEQGELAERLTFILPFKPEDLEAEDDDFADVKNVDVKWVVGKDQWVKWKGCTGLTVIEDGQKTPHDKLTGKVKLESGVELYFFEGKVKEK
ncbi:hypothetical protein G7Y89_g11105 [Cudoniella acicularis]|uniref:Uncharacterized protein n=1 Tax=Cudoniella acicularis TaxID=354080 RepID=A0A8H4RDU2_9HELO|nr:hypothetical protein G7Y89_g11105 [Cudoniella acicularis]